MLDNKFNFTDNKLRKLPPSPAGKRRYFYDGKTPGLRLQVTGAGTISFQFQARSKQQNRIVTTTLGRYPKMSIHNARKQAAELMNATHDGEDIEERARQVRQEQTLEELFLQWLEQFAKPHKKSWAEDVRRYKNYVSGPLGGKKLSWFTPSRIRTWHRKITQRQKQRGKKGETISPATANRALALVSTVFNQMVPEQQNPCSSVKKFQEKSRERFLGPEDIRRFLETLDHPDTPTDLKDYLLISIFTGARRSNILAMRFTDIDFDLSVWSIPADQSKNSEAMNIPLVPPVMTILKTRKARTTSIFVFASKRSRSGHIEEPKRAWTSFKDRAGLNDVRLHDLRRTLGSWQTMTGASTAIVGKTLGHKSQQTTAVYARTNLDPVRDSVERAVQAMLGTQTLPLKVVNLRAEDDLKKI